MYGVYLRLGVHVHASWRDVICAAAKKLRPAARAIAALRTIRKAFYRQMLAYHANDQKPFAR